MLITFGSCLFTCVCVTVVGGSLLLCVCCLLCFGDCGVS